jgi:hypothetical protein
MILHNCGAFSDVILSEAAVVNFASAFFATLGTKNFTGSSKILSASHILLQGFVANPSSRVPSNPKPGFLG